MSSVIVNNRKKKAKIFTKPFRLVLINLLVKYAMSFVLVIG